MKQGKTLSMVQLALLTALIVMLSFIPYIGYIKIPVLAVQATTIHIPVIVGSILLGPKAGGFLGFVFGLTSLINNIYAAASEKKDFRTMQFLDWFVKEQGEEEKNADDLIKKWDLFGADARALYMLDSELSARTYAAPSLTL